MSSSNLTFKELMKNTAKQLKSMATARRLSPAGTKKQISNRILQHQREQAASVSSSMGTGVTPEPSAAAIHPSAPSIDAFGASPGPSAFGRFSPDYSPESPSASQQGELPRFDDQPFMEVEGDGGEGKMHDDEDEPDAIVLQQSMTEQQMASLEQHLRKRLMQEANIQFTIPRISEADAGDDLRALILSFLSGSIFQSVRQGEVQGAPIHTRAVWLSNRANMINGLCHITGVAYQRHMNTQSAQPLRPDVNFAMQMCVMTNNIFARANQLRAAIDQERRGQSGGLIDIMWVFIGKQLKKIVPMPIADFFGMLPQTSRAWNNLEAALDKFRNYYNAQIPSLLTDLNEYTRMSLNPSADIIAGHEAIYAEAAEDWTKTQQFLSKELDLHDSPAYWPVFLRPVLQWIQWTQEVSQFRAVGMIGIEQAERVRSVNPEAIQDFVRIRQIKASAMPTLRRMMAQRKNEILANTDEEVQASQRQYRRDLEAAMRQRGVGHAIPVFSMRQGQNVSRQLHRELRGPEELTKGGTPQAQSDAYFAANKMTRTEEARRRTEAAIRARQRDIEVENQSRELRDRGAAQMSAHMSDLRLVARQGYPNPPLSERIAQAQQAELRAFLLQQIRFREILSGSAGGAPENRNVPLWHIIFQHAAASALYATVQHFLNPGLGQQGAIDFNSVLDAINQFQDAVNNTRAPTYTLNTPDGEQFSTYISNLQKAMPNPRSNLGQHLNQRRRKRGGRKKRKTKKHRKRKRKTKRKKLKKRKRKKTRKH